MGTLRLLSPSSPCENVCLASGIAINVVSPTRTDVLLAVLAKESSGYSHCRWRSLLPLNASSVLRKGSLMMLLASDDTPRPCVEDARDMQSTAFRT